MGKQNPYSPNSVGIRRGVSCTEIAVVGEGGPIQPLMYIAREEGADLIARKDNGGEREDLIICT